jgi:hypothetical protein
MRAFLQNCPRDYDNDTEQKKLMNPQDVASCRSVLEKVLKMQEERAGKTRARAVSCGQIDTALSHEKTRQGPTEVEGIDNICSIHNTSSVYWHHYCDCHKTNHITSRLNLVHT